MIHYCIVLVKQISLDNLISDGYQRLPVNRERHLTIVVSDI